MIYSSFLIDVQTALTLDTSVLINLHASRHGSRVLGAIPNEIFVPEMVAEELEHDTSKANGEHLFIRELAATGKVKVVSLTDREYEVFASLVSGSRSLGDGEAATIAVSVCREHLPVIDERKGRQLALAQMPGKEPGWSLDLLCHPKVVAALGDNESVEALYLALRDGRMRIHEDHCDYVVDVIGIKRALDCNSLPGYKIRRRSWLSSASHSEYSEVDD